MYFVDLLAQSIKDIILIVGGLLIHGNWQLVDSDCVVFGNFI